MLLQRNWMRQREIGFTLMELMVIVAVVGILAAIAVPNFLNYRNKSRIAAAISTGESIRASFASFAANSPDNLFPAMTAITDYATLLTVVNHNGGTLKTSAADMGLGVGNYFTQDTDGDGVDDTYGLNLTVLGAPNTMRGKVIRITPNGILKCNAAGTNCQ